MIEHMVLMLFAGALGYMAVWWICARMDAHWDARWIDRFGYPNPDHDSRKWWALGLLYPLGGAVGSLTMIALLTWVSALMETCSVTSCSGEPATTFTIRNTVYEAPVCRRHGDMLDAVNAKSRTMDPATMPLSDDEAELIHDLHENALIMCVSMVLGSPPDAVRAVGNYERAVQLIQVRRLVRKTNEALK